MKSTSKRAVWIGTILFAFVIKLIAISCLVVYLMDRGMVPDVPIDQNTTHVHPDGEIHIPVVPGEGDAYLNCQPLSCDPRCLAEWYEGNFTCEVGITNGGPVDYRQQKPTKANHRTKALSTGKLTKVAALTDIERMFSVELEPLLIPRVSGTPGNIQARTHIIQRLKSLRGWQVTEDTFTANTPYNRKAFSNIIATHDPQSTARRLVLACHYDSKFFSRGTFIGATDSAVPCAMLLDLAYSLDDILFASPLEMVTLQLMFFDGEEAFKSWTDEDSLYGSRHLAELMERTPYPAGSKSGTTELDRMDMLVLLDLLGVQNPTFENHFPAQTGKWFQHMQKIEKRLSTGNLLQSHTMRNPYFKTQRRSGRIQDDHIPFLQRGVACFHVIATPFPHVWHKASDNKYALHKPTINNLNKMFQVFTVEYLHLRQALRKRRNRN